MRDRRYRKIGGVFAGIYREDVSRPRTEEFKVDDLQILTWALKRLIRACSAGRPIERCPILMSLEEKEKGGTKKGGAKR